MRRYWPFLWLMLAYKLKISEQSKQNLLKSSQFYLTLTLLVGKIKVYTVMYYLPEKVCSL